MDDFSDSDDSELLLIPLVLPDFNLEMEYDRANSDVEEPNHDTTSTETAENQLQSEQQEQVADDASTVAETLQNINDIATDQAERTFKIQADENLHSYFPSHTFFL